MTKNIIDIYEKMAISQNEIFYHLTDLVEQHILLSLVAFYCS